MTKIKLRREFKIILFFLFIITIISVLWTAWYIIENFDFVPTDRLYSEKDVVERKDNKVLVVLPDGTREVCGTICCASNIILDLVPDGTIDDAKRIAGLINKEDSVMPIIDVFDKTNYYNEYRIKNINPGSIQEFEDTMTILKNIRDSKLEKIKEDLRCMQMPL